MRSAFCFIRLRSWVLQSVPPVIVSHIWGALCCMLVVLQSARLVWDNVYVKASTVAMKEVEVKTEMGSLF